MQTYAQHYSRETIGMQAIHPIESVEQSKRVVIPGTIVLALMSRCEVRFWVSVANEKLSGLYIRGHRGVLVMQNSRTNWIPPGDTSLSFMELIPARQENVWRDVRGLRSPRSRDRQMKISSWSRYCRETGRDSEYVIAKLAPAFVTEKMGLEFIFPRQPDFLVFLRLPWFCICRGYILVTGIMQG